MTQVKFARRPFHNGFNNLVDDLFADLPVLFKDGNRNTQVPINIKENEHGYELQVFAPGFEKADFKVTVEKQLLTISAAKKQEEKNEQKENILRNEFNLNSFKRSFSLDDKFNSDGIEAKYVNGVLTLNLPRKEEVKPASKLISIE